MKFSCLAFQGKANESQLSEASCSRHYTSQTLIRKHQNNNNISPAAFGRKQNMNLISLNNSVTE